VTMTLPALSPSARDALEARLADLKSQRAQAALESIPPGGSGDAADHAGNVEALIRLEELDVRIANLQLQLQAPIVEVANVAAAEIGSRVTLRFGDDEEPEEFLIGFVEQASARVDVVTPSSPLGTVLLGAHPGQRLNYRSSNGAEITATLIAVTA